MDDSIQIELGLLERLLAHLIEMMAEGGESYPARQYEQVMDDIAALAIVIAEFDHPDNW